MKLEQLASLLGKDATELQGTLNLDGQADVPDDTLTKELTNYVKELGLTKFNEGKKQGEGMAKRLVMSENEKSLREAFNVDGANFSEIIDNLKSLKSENKADEKILKERDQWKSTALSKDAEIQNLKTQFENIQLSEKVKSFILPKIDRFDFTTSKVRDVAVNDFIQNRKFKIEGSDIFIEKNDSFFTLSENEIENHFKEYGVAKTVKNGTPPRNNSTSYGLSKADIFKDIEKATTPDEIARLREALAALEN